MLKDLFNKMKTKPEDGAGSIDASPSQGVHGVSAGLQQAPLQVQDPTPGSVGGKPASDGVPLTDSTVTSNPTLSAQEIQPTTNYPIDQTMGTVNEIPTKKDVVIPEISGMDRKRGKGGDKVDMLLDQVKQLIDINKVLNNKVKAVEDGLENANQKVVKNQGELASYADKMRNLEDNLHKFVNVVDKMLDNQQNLGISTPETNIPKTLTADPIPVGSANDEQSLSHLEESVPAIADGLNAAAVEAPITAEINPNLESASLNSAPIVENDTLEVERPIIEETPATIPEESSGLPTLPSFSVDEKIAPGPTNEEANVVIAPKEEKEPIVSAEAAPTELNQLQQSLGQAASETITPTINPIENASPTTPVPVKEVEESNHPLSSQAPVGSEFVFRDGHRVRNAIELLGMLKTIDDSEFLAHVDGTKNDFANWVKDSLNNDILGSEMAKQNSRPAMISLIEAFL